MSEFDYLLKLIVVGDGGVGKTAISVRFAEGVFQDDYKMTIGVDFSIKTINVPINGEIRRVKLQIWDTGGQEQFSYIRPLYYKGAVGGVVVFDLTDRKSFENLDRWFTEVADNCLSIPLVLVGNKADLFDRKIDPVEVETITKKLNIDYLESSARSGQSINSIFETLSRTIISIEEGLIRPKEYDEKARKYKEFIEIYMTLAEQAYFKMNNYNYNEALPLLKKAYHYAKEIKYQEGKQWVEEQTQYILNIVNK